MNALFEVIVCALIKFFNLMLYLMFGWWMDFLAFILELLPDADISADPVEWGVFGNSIGYFIPVSDMINHFAVIIGLYALYLSIQHFLRFFRFIR